MGYTVIDKQQLLENLRQAIAGGVVSEQEVRDMLSPQSDTIAPAAVTTGAPAPVRPKISAVEVMFYIAGIVLFSAIMSYVFQLGDGSNIVLRFSASAGVGACLWLVAYILHRQPTQTDITRGLDNSLALSGSLSIITGSFLLAQSLAGIGGSITPLSVAVTLAVLYVLHILYDHLVHKDLLFLLAVVMGAGVFPALMAAILQPLNPSSDVWAVVSLGSLGLLVAASRVTEHMQPDRRALHRPFDALAVFLGLSTMFAASFDSYGIFWLALMIAAVFALFYTSIVLRSKAFLGTASVFLVVAVLTISFRYFRGAGASFSLIIAAIGLIGSAAIASSINRKYFKAPR
jgi:hypothetical protein